MAIYATKQDLIDRDEQMLWNFAINRETGELNDTYINQALEQADDEINSFLGRRYQLPLPTVPGMLNKIAIIIAFIGWQTVISRPRTCWKSATKCSLKPCVKSPVVNVS